MGGGIQEQSVAQEDVAQEGITTNKGVQQLQKAVCIEGMGCRKEITGIREQKSQPQMGSKNVYEGEWQKVASLEYQDGERASTTVSVSEKYHLRNIKRGGEIENAGSYLIDVKKGRMRIRMMVALALGVVVLCIGIGGSIMHLVEKLGWLDSFYLSIMLLTTVGYDDRAFKSMSGRIFASISLLVSTITVACAFLYLA
ncbi:hypothetical protein K2173_001368 [Erythroxylum novogranatense]|uniref:Potassium channel domain-containing protein n=1 Tax=Erythroxylum novogranatense TaxID=1862640 RepID=A0AAV8T3Q7_9ROSI|nr:hypothetical protein K2173_001368 [Erythroxylum novogranatense]